MGTTKSSGKLRTKKSSEIFCNVGPTGACTAITHTNVLENRGTKWKAQTKQTKSKEGQKQVPKQLCFNPILVAERVPFTEYINPRAPLVESYLSRPFG